ncbi:Histone-lysine N-methyltransferase SMYD1 [Dissostichus eleginoides]|uniref:[histone H3]-lysine(4) N-trimethyltransferase n=1 Tax=Dissostichus eleginoides TaxID=100907 RepID=A0AAD9F4Y2_DISEL|nr:Histone-lysine N-methyltransferase SMYD1 [Dissostichus eleginoides]
MSDINSTNPRTLGRGICIITGASKGFGQALAYQVSRSLEPRSVLLLVARSGPLLQEMKEGLQSATEEQQLVVHCVAVDLRTKEGVDETVRVARQEAVDEIEHVLLINNAASLGDIAKFETFTNPEEAGPTMECGKPLVYVCTAGLTLLGAILHRQSSRNMMFSVLAKEQQHVKVLSYSPGPMETDMQKEILRLTNVNHNPMPCHESAAKLMKLLLDNNFSSGAHLDFFDLSNVTTLDRQPLLWAKNTLSNRAPTNSWSGDKTCEFHVEGDKSPPTHFGISGTSAGTMENVAIFESPGKGRGLKATKEFWAGDVIFAEPSVAAVVLTAERICHSCFRREEKLQKCGQCKFAHYCDRTCQRAGWAEHKLECSAIKTYGKAPNENIRLGARILWRLDKDGSMMSDTQMVTLEELEDHIADMPEDDLKDFKVDIHNFLDYWPRSSKQHTIDDTFHIFGVINCNGFTVSDQRGLQAVGVGLFPNLCMVNHNCWPNCTVILNHGNQSAVNTMFHSQRRIELRSLSKIEGGDELTVSYVDFLNMTEERQRLLKTQYFFDCTCEHCKDHVKDDLKLGGLEVDGVKPTEEQVKEATDYCFEMMEKMEKARLNGNYHEVVKSARIAWRRQNQFWLTLTFTSCGCGAR